MLKGVILWIDQQRDAAMIWCDDHNKLAYARRGMVTGTSVDDWDQGDLVEIEYHDAGPIRYCVRLDIIEKKSLRSDLAAQLVDHANSNHPTNPAVTTKV